MKRVIVLFFVYCVLIASAFAAGLWFDRLYNPAMTKCPDQLNHAARSLAGCEVIANQCLNDVQEAEYYFKRCISILEELRQTK